MTIRDILVGIDGTTAGESLLRSALGLARDHKAYLAAAYCTAEDHAAMVLAGAPVNPSPGIFVAPEVLTAHGDTASDPFPQISHEAQIADRVQHLFWNELQREGLNGEWHLFASKTVGFIGALPAPPRGFRDNVGRRALIAWDGHPGLRFPRTRFRPAETRLPGHLATTGRGWWQRASLRGCSHRSPFQLMPISRKAAFDRRAFRHSQCGECVDAPICRRQRPLHALAHQHPEKVTGARADRRELNRMLGKLAPGDVVAVTRIDRLARSTFDLFGSSSAAWTPRHNSEHWRPTNDGPTPAPGFGRCGLGRPGRGRA
jgi:Resolvase, N terminal domain